MAQRTGEDAELDITAQVAALRAQVDRLLGRGGETASDVAREVHRATMREVDTLAAQARNEPVATALFVLAGAVLGFVLGRAAR
jgi:hypothetical protein